MITETTKKSTLKSYFFKTVRKSLVLNDLRPREGGGADLSR